MKPGKNGLTREPPTPEVLALFEDLSGIIQKHYRSVPAIEMIGVFAQSLGRMMAHPTGYDIDTVFNVVMSNMKQGNADVAAETSDVAGHA